MYCNGTLKLVNAMCMSLSASTQKIQFYVFQWFPFRFWHHFNHKENVEKAENSEHPERSGHPQCQLQCWKLLQETTHACGVYVTLALQCSVVEGQCSEGGGQWGGGAGREFPPNLFKQFRACARIQHCLSFALMAAPLSSSAGWKVIKNLEMKQVRLP